MAKARIQVLLLSLVAGSLGVGAGYGLGKLHLVSAGPRPSPVLLIGSLLAWGFGAILLHELGHVAGGRLAGFRFVMLTVGPFRFAREAAGYRFGWNRSLAQGGGLALSLPESGRATSGQMLRYVAGGPVTSLLLTGGLVLLALTSGGSGSQFVWVMGAVMNAGISLASLLPSTVGGFGSDGKQLLDILRGGHLAELKLATQAVIADSIFGVRPREWPADRIAHLEALAHDRSGLAAVAALLVAHFHYLDRGDRSAAAAALASSRRAMDDSTSLLNATVALEEAYLAALDADPVTARDRFAAGSTGYSEPHTRARVEAAVLMVEGKAKAAAERAREGLALLGRSLDRGGAMAEREWMQALAGGLAGSRQPSA